MQNPFPTDKFKQGLFKNCGLKEIDYERFWLVWQDKNGDNAESEKQYIWYWYEQLLESIQIQFAESKKEMYENMRNVYYEMLRFLMTDKESKDIATKGINDCELQLAALHHYEVVVNIIGDNCCDNCDELNGKRYNLNTLLEQSLLPNTTCTRERGCICCYGFLPIMNSNGGIILKNEQQNL